MLFLPLCILNLSGIVVSRDVLPGIVRPRIILHWRELELPREGVVHYLLTEGGYAVGLRWLPILVARWWEGVMPTFRQIGRAHV